MKSQSKSRHIAILAFLLLLIAPKCYAPEARPMRVLATGEVDPTYCPISSYGAIEPSLDVTLAVAREMHGTTFGEKGLKRLIRLYIPRNLEEMLQYDFILLNQPVIRYFPLSSLEQMRSVIADHGAGGLCFMQSMYSDIYTPWLETELSDCFPYNHYAYLRLGAPGGQSYNLEVVKDPHLPPLMTPYVSLGIENVKPFGEARPTFEKEGATVWAYCRAAAFRAYGLDRFPLFISWEYGPGRALVWTTADQFDSPMWRTNDGKERYALDIFTGMVWLSSGWDLPDDPVRVRVMRDSFTRLRARMSLIGSLIEFIDDFGASTYEVEVDLGSLQSMVEEAGRLYLEHEFEATEMKFSEAFDFASEIEARSVMLKDRALMWVYLIEWVAVTGTFLLAGFLLWTLMVRRRVYREVMTTRSSV